MARKNRSNPNEPTGNETGEELQVDDSAQETSATASQDLLAPPATPTLADALSPDEVAALKDVSENAPVAIPTGKEGEFIAADDAGDIDLADDSETGAGQAGDINIAPTPVEHSNEEQPAPKPDAKDDAPAEPVAEVSDETAPATDATAGVVEPEVSATAPVPAEAGVTEAPILLNNDPKPPVGVSPGTPENIEPPAKKDDVVEPEPEAPAPEPESKSLAALRVKYAGAIELHGDQAWDYAALALYDEKRVIPTRTTSGQWPVDVRRTAELTTWSDGALIDWANGEIKTPNGVSAESLHDELYRRYRLPNNWTEAAAVEYINTGKKPETTPNGLLLEDRARASSPLHHWSFQELRAAVLGEIDTLGHDVGDVVTTLRKRIGLTSTTSDDKIIKSLKDNTGEVSMDNTLLDAKLGEIKAAFLKSGNNLSAATAGEIQTVLYRTIREVMAREPENFHEGWLKLTNWVNENYNTLFTPEKARRGFSQLALPTSHLTTFEDLMTLLIRTRNPATRVQDAKIYNVGNMLRHVTSEKERQNVLGFYSGQF